MTRRQARARDLLTVALALSAGVHAALAPEHWRERPALGLGFAVAAAALAATAAWLQLAQRQLPAGAAVLLLAGLSGTYLLSRTRGVPVAGREGWDAVGVATQAVQLLGLVAAQTLLRPSRRPSPAHPTRTRGGSFADPSRA